MSRINDRSRMILRLQRSAPNGRDTQNSESQRKQVRQNRFLTIYSHTSFYQRNNVRSPDDQC